MSLFKAIPLAETSGPHSRAKTVHSAETSGGHITRKTGRLADTSDRRLYGQNSALCGNLGRNFELIFQRPKRYLGLCFTGTSQLAMTPLLEILVHNYAVCNFDNPG